MNKELFHFFNRRYWTLSLQKYTQPNLPEDVRDDALFISQTARDAINSWKSHQLRMVHQDNGRTDILDILEQDSALIVQDFAMKFIPAQYRETQRVLWQERDLLAYNCLPN